MDTVLALILKGSEILFRPEVFKIFLWSMAGLSLVLVVVYLRLSKKQARLLKNDKNNLAQAWQNQLKVVDSRVKEMEMLCKDREEALRRKGEELIKKEEILRSEVLAKEKILKELEVIQSQLVQAKSQLELKEKELFLVSKLKPEIAAKEEVLSGLQQELGAAQEMYNGLKEQYDDLELQLDALNQSFALEKTLHSRLQEEHAQCQKPIPS